MDNKLFEDIFSNYSTETTDFTNLLEVPLDTESKPVLYLNEQNNIFENIYEICCLTEDEDWDDYDYKKINEMICENED